MQRQLVTAIHGTPPSAALLTLKCNIITALPTAVSALLDKTCHAQVFRQMLHLRPRNGV
jgi:hypothetical protein